MFCHQKKCFNLPDWEDRSGRVLCQHFLNWMSHRVSFIGYDTIGINEEIFTNLGDEERDV